MPSCTSTPTRPSMAGLTHMYIGQHSSSEWCLELLEEIQALSENERSTRQGSLQVSDSRVM